MTGRQRIMAALRREPVDRVPTFEWFIDEGVGEALTGSRCPLDIAERLDLDGVNVRADYARRSVGDGSFVDEWGATRADSGECIPMISESPVKDVTRHGDYRFPDPRAEGRFASLEEATTRFGEERAVIFNLRDGWSDMRDLLGYEDSLMSVLTEPEHFMALLERVVDHNLALAAEAVERFGTRVIATTDDVATATGLLFPAEVYVDILGPAFRRTIEGFKSLGCLTVKHCDGDARELMDFWIDSGIDCFDPVDPGAGLTMGEFKRAYGERICLKGNVDCTGALCSGTEDEVADEVRECILAGKLEGLILSSSNTIHRGVRPENYRAMLGALRRFGSRDGIAP
jgi:uroporphyrinogen decarboxylase